MSLFSWFYGSMTFDLPERERFLFLNTEILSEFGEISFKSKAVLNTLASDNMTENC